ncbi:putative heme iron utilization protein [Yersinia enterocolitica]|nr:putative heme iron utilization protein [Yersinia enterocolitica]
MNAPTLQNKPSLAEFLATQPDGTLEQIAQDYQVSPLDVVRELPKRILVSAEHFDRVWDSMTEWGDRCHHPGTYRRYYFGAQRPTAERFSSPRLFQPSRETRS